jgi:hypothetical protein
MIAPGDASAHEGSVGAFLGGFTSLCALIGVLYVAVLVARIVGIYARRVSDE